jgi:hypothetical protein
MYGYTIYICLVRDGVFVLGQLLYCFAYAAEASVTFVSFVDLDAITSWLNQIPNVPRFRGHFWDVGGEYGPLGSHLSLAMRENLLVAGFKVGDGRLNMGCRWVYGQPKSISGPKWIQLSGNSLFRNNDNFLWAIMGQQGNFNGCYHRMILIGSTHDVCSLFSEKPKKWRIVIYMKNTNI